MTGPAMAAHASAARTPAQAGDDRVGADSGRPTDAIYEIVYRQPFPLERQAVAGVAAETAVAMMVATLDEHAGAVPAAALRAAPIGSDLHRCWVVLVETGSRIALFNGLGPADLGALLAAHRPTAPEIVQ